MSVRAYFRPALLVAVALVVSTVDFAANTGVALDTTEVDLVGSTNLARTQAAPAVARDAIGDAVVVWQGDIGGTTPDGGNIYMHRINNLGVVQGAQETQVSTDTGATHVQSNPAVAMSPSGAFVVVWESTGQDNTNTSDKGVYLQRYDNAGTAQGTETQVNITTAGDQGAPSVAMAADGSFVVVWESLSQDGSGYGVYARRYNASGTALDPSEVQVNTTTTNSQRFPAVSMTPAGNFVVVWQSSAQDGDLNGIYAQRFMADGTRVGGEFAINSITTGDQTAPAVAMRPDGSFVAVWQGPDSSGTGIYMRRFDVSNQPLDVADVAVNAGTSDTADLQSAPSVTTDANGNTVVVWESNNQAPDSAGYGIFLRRYNASGAVQGGTTAVNTITTGDQRAPAVASDADGDYLVVWQDPVNSGDIMMKRFSGPEDVDLGVTKSANSGSVTTGQPLTYTITVANFHAQVTTTGVAAIDNAIGAATNVQVVDALPSGTTYQPNQTNGTNWTCTNNSPSTGKVTCNYGVPLAAGGSTQFTIQVLAPTAAPAGNVITNDAKVFADQNDTVTNGNNDATADANICGASDSTGTFSIASTSVTEGSTATVTVTRTPTPGTTLCGPATIQYATSDGTATAPADYVAASGTLNFPDGTAVGTAQTATFSVSTIADGLDENAETVNLAIANPSSGSIGLNGAGAAVLTINDNDPPPAVIIATADDPNFSEGAGTKQLVVKLRNQGDTADILSGRDVVVPFTMSGSAILTVPNGSSETADYTVTPNNPMQVTIQKGSNSATISLNVIDDSKDEPNETMVTTLTASSGSDPTYVFLANNAKSVQTTTIVDNDPTPSLSVSDVSVSEGSGSGTTTLTFTVTLSAVSGQDVTVNYATGDDPNAAAEHGAIAGTDYTPVNSTLTFSHVAADTSKTVAVTINRDSLSEYNETFAFNLSNPSNATIGRGTAIGTIIDDDVAPTVSLNANQTVAESAGTATFTATLSAAAGRKVTVPYTISGTATQGQGSDYTLTGDVPSPFVFAPGETTKTITVNINDDALNEATETVINTLGSPTNATLGTTSSSTISITDNDPTPTVFFDTAMSDASKREDQGPGTIQLKLSAVSGQDVTVPITVGGSASSPGDYTLSNVTSNTVTIPAGTQEVPITVNIVNDTAQESNETVTLAQPTGSGAAVPTNANWGTPASFTFTIVDDDGVPQVFFDPASVSKTVSESAGTVTLPIRLSRTNGTDITVSYSLSGTAQSGLDFGAITPSSPITIPAGTPPSGIVLSIPITNDSLDENDETVTVTLTNPVNATVPNYASQPASATVTIQDDDTAGVTVTESGGSTNVTEGGATDSYTIVLNSQPTADVTVTVNGTSQATVNGGATATLTFTSSNWNVAQVVTVTAVDDNLAEGDHTTVLTQSTSSADALYSGLTLPGVTVHITDNDTASIAVTESGGSTLVSEAGQTDSYALVLTTQPTANVSFTVNADSQVRVNGGASVNVTFTNANWNVPQTITVSAVDDQVAEGTHSGLITHSAATSSDGNYTGLSARSVTPQITDNDTAGLVFSKSSVNVAEGGATDTYTVKLSSQPTGNVTVTLDGGSQLLVSNGGAAAQSVQLTFTTIGQSPSGWDVPQTVTVTAVDDNVAEGTPHSGMITHSDSSSDANYTSSNAGVVTASITDNDMSGISINDVTVTEGNSGTTNANFVVSLSTPSSTDVTVDFATASGTATSGVDFQPTAGTLLIPAGQTSGIVAVPVLGDTLDESDETYTVNLSNATGGATIAKAVGIGTITDDDSASYTINDVTVTEGNSGTVAATFTVTRTAADHATSVDFATANGTATAGSDYTASSGTLNFPANSGSSTQTITVQVAGDTIDEADETYTVNLSNASAGTTIAKATGTGTITDDDSASYSIDDVTVTEGNSGTTAMVFTVTRTAADHATTVNFATADGTAVAGSDYTATIGTLNFVSSTTASTKTITVQVTGDTIVESTETFTVNLSAPSAGTTIAKATGTGTITDDDSVAAGDGAPGVAVTPSGSVASGGGNGGGFSWTGLLGLLGFAALRRGKRMGALLLLLGSGSALAVESPVLTTEAQQPPAAVAPAAAPDASTTASPPAPAADTPAAPAAETPAAAAPAPLPQEPVHKEPPRLATRQELSYSSLDLRYLSVKIKDPGASANGFSLAGSWAVGASGFLMAGYSSIGTSDFTLSGTTGSSDTKTLSAGAGMHFPMGEATDFAGSVMALSAKAQGQGGFTGNTSDTGYGVEGALRGRLSPSVEWRLGVDWVSLFGDTGTSADGQLQWRMGSSFATLLGAGFGSHASQFNIGARYLF